MAKDRLTAEEIKNEMLLRTGHEGRIPWHIAAFRGKINIMQKIWEWVKERLTTEEMKCYYAQTLREGTLGTLQHTCAN